MKPLTIILIFTISFLTAAPTFQNYFQKDECAQNCCSDEEGDCDEQSGPDCCPNGICNPFEICTCCVTPTVQRSGFTFLINNSQNKILPTAVSFIVSDFSSDCWQPPETV